MESQPIPLRILEEIKCRDGISLQELSLILGLDEQNLKPFLDVLQSRGVISQRDGLYFKGRNFGLESQISQVYQCIQHACLDFLRKIIIQRGSILKRELMRLALQNGFDRDQVEQLLEEEISKGYLRIIQIPGLGSREWFVPVRYVRISLSRIYYLGWNWFVDREARLTQEKLIVSRYPADIKLQYLR